MEASVDGTTLTGRVLGEIVDGQRKKELLETIARQEGISLEQVYRARSKLTLDHCGRRWGERPLDALTFILRSCLQWKTKVTGERIFNLRFV
jgi:hypothetical protein